MNANLHLGDEAVDLRIGRGARIGLNDPARDAVLLGEFDCCQRRCERMIQLGKSHRLAKSGAAENGEPVHSVSGDVDRCTDAVWQVRVAREKLWGGRRRSWHLHRPHELMEVAPWPKSMISAEA